MKFKKIYNNCYYLRIEDKIILISYESIIGVIKYNSMFISQDFIKYSKTTSKHINLFKKNFDISKEVLISNWELEKLIN